jgi:hypothetical protein
MTNTITVELEFYAVRSKDGKWYRSVGGHGGSGKNCWVDELKKARVWGSTAPARAIINYFATNHPNYPVPDLVILKVTSGELVDETVRVAKAIQKKQERTKKHEAANAKYRLELAQRDLDAAQQAIKRLNG